MYASILLPSVVGILFIGFGVSDRTFSTIQPSGTAVAKAETSVSPYQYQAKYVPGRVYDRIYTIFLENTNYGTALKDENLKSLRKKGITLTNYWALTHPSQPNYLGSVAGDYFGLDTDAFVRVPSEVESVVDLLDERGISWGEYEEGMPYPGYQGFDYSETNRKNYVRKHNPLVLLNSVPKNETRLSMMKNFTEFYKDLHNHRLPQWSFITPNMTNDGHDTSLKHASHWAENFLKPLLDDHYFKHRTLVVLTFDESESYDKPNRVLTILLGDIPGCIMGTKDHTYYDHYSLLATVEKNWRLRTLGRHDCHANVFSFIACHVSHKNRHVGTSNLLNNKSKPGYFTSKKHHIPKPDLKCEQ